MEEGKLPTEVAQEPQEEARLSQTQTQDSETDLNNNETMHKRKGVTFAETTQSSENPSQSSTSTYKEALSQPAPNLSHRQKLLWLQKRRNPGLWVQCDECNKWRFVANVIDSHELPAKWLCKMNPDKSASNCSIPEKPIRLREEEDLIHGIYSAGSVVCARLPGWPWWPAMVDDCPDTEQYYWLDGFSDIPTHYNVVFFDSSEVTRAWIAPENLKPFAPNKKSIKLPKTKALKRRLEVAITQAEDADKLSLEKRLAKYSFLSRYTGSINEPKNVTKRELERVQKKFKRKYNVAFPIERSSDEEEMPANIEKTTIIQKKENLLLVGNPKSKQKKERTSNDKPLYTIIKPDDVTDTLPSDKNHTDDNETNCNTEDSLKVTEQPDTDTANETFKQPTSLVVQVGSTVTSTAADFSYDNDTSATYIPGSESETEVLHETAQSINNRAVSPSSDDFEF